MNERRGPNGPSETCDGLFFFLGEPTFKACPMVNGEPQLDQAWTVFSRKHGADQLGIERKRRYRNIRLRLIAKLYGDDDPYQGPEP